MTIEKITRIIWWRSITKTLFFLQLVITLFFLRLSIRIFSSLYCPIFKHKRNNCKCVALCPLPFPVSLFCWSPLFEKPGMSFAECYLKGRLKNAGGEKDKSSTNVSFNFADIFRASREKIFISYGLIINNYHRCMLRHIEWYACGCLLLIFRESALVKHSFYEKLLDNDLLLTNANALLSVQYRYHALSLVSVIWETRTSFAEWYMKGSPKHYGRWKKNTSFT